MPSNKFKHEINVLVTGRPNVGKTTLINSIYAMYGDQDISKYQKNRVIPKSFFRNGAQHNFEPYIGNITLVGHKSHLITFYDTNYSFDNDSMNCSNDNIDFIVVMIQEKDLPDILSIHANLWKWRNNQMKKLNKTIHFIIIITFCAKSIVTPFAKLSMQHQIWEDLEISASYIYFMDPLPETFPEYTNDITTLMDQLIYMYYLNGTGSSTKSNYDRDGNKINHIANSYNSSSNNYNNNNKNGTKSSCLLL